MEVSSTASHLFPAQASHAALAQGSLAQEHISSGGNGLSRDGREMEEVSLVIESGGFERRWHGWVSFHCVGSDHVPDDSQQARRGCYRGRRADVWRKLMEPLVFRVYKLVCRELKAKSVLLKAKANKQHSVMNPLAQSCHHFVRLGTAG